MPIMSAQTRTRPLIWSTSLAHNTPNCPPRVCGWYLRQRLPKNTGDSHPAPVTPAAPNVAVSDPTTIQSGPETPVRIGNNLRTFSIQVSLSACKKIVTASEWVGCLCRKITPITTVSLGLAASGMSTYHCLDFHLRTHAEARADAEHYPEVVDQKTFSLFHRI